MREPEPKLTYVIVSVANTAPIENTGAPARIAQGAPSPLECQPDVRIQGRFPLFRYRLTAVLHVTILHPAVVEFSARTRSVPKAGGKSVPPKLTSILPILRGAAGEPPPKPAAPKPPVRPRPRLTVINTISMLVLIGMAAKLWLSKSKHVPPPKAPVAAAVPAPAEPAPVQAVELPAPAAPPPAPKAMLVVEGRTPGPGGQELALDGWVQVFKTDRSAAELIRAAQESEAVKEAVDALRVSERAKELIGKSATLEQNKRIHLAALGEALRAELIGAELVGDGVLEDGEAVLSELPPSPPEGYLLYGFGTADGNIAGLYGNAVVREGENASARPDELVYAAGEEDWTGARWKPLSRE